MFIAPEPLNNNRRSLNVVSRSQYQRAVAGGSRIARGAELKCVKSCKLRSAPPNGVRNLAVGQFYKYRTTDGVQGHTKHEILSRVIQRSNTWV